MPPYRSFQLCTNSALRIFASRIILPSTYNHKLSKVAMTQKLQLQKPPGSATASLQRLAQMQYTAQPKSDETFRQDFSVELSGLASVEYTGPCEPLIEQIAKTANVRVSKIGSPTATAIIVSISAKSAPLSEIVQNIAYQVQSHASISFNSDTKVIEIIYHNA